MCVSIFRVNVLLRLKFRIRRMKVKRNWLFLLMVGVNGELDVVC